ncbi:unnamed protein product [Knipowitschia caucasica]
MPQLQIILLGGRNSGKSGVGNLLLGKEEFVARERTCSCRRVGAMGSQWLTVVDTPGWWCDLSTTDTSELVKREIVTSVSLCNPAPHLFIIVVKARSIFTEQRRKAVEEHVQLLGRDVWDRCFLLLAFNHSWRLTKAEEHVERAGKALQWVYDKCGRRCHSLVLDEEHCKNIAQIPELMAKIRTMVAASGSIAFEMPGAMLLKATEEKRRMKQRAHFRFVKMKERRATQRAKVKPMTEIRIVLLGAKGYGKSSVFNTILGNNQENSETTRTACNRVGQATVFGRHVTVVDTPGWWCNYYSHETPMFDKREMVLSLSLCPPGPHAFLLVIRVDRAFTDTYRRAIEEHVEVISDRIWNRLIVLFTFGDWLGSTTTEQYIESEGKPLQWVVDRCDNRYHILNNKTKGDGFQVRELLGKIEEMVSATGSDWYFEIEQSVVKNLNQKITQEAEQAEARRMVKKEQREAARANLDNFTPLSELRVVLIGGSKTGKSSCGNTIFARGCFKPQTLMTSFHKNKVKSSVMVTVLDTPGSFCVNNELFRTSSAFLIVVNVTSAFKYVHLKAIKDQLEEVGAEIWGKAIVLFSFGDCLGSTAIEQRIESEGNFLRRLVNKCGNRYHVLNNKNPCKRQVHELIDLIEEITLKERRRSLQNSDCVTREIQQKQQKPEAVCGMDSHGENSQLSSHDAANEASQLVPHGRSFDRARFQDICNFSASLPNGKRLSWTVAGQNLASNLPVWPFGDDTQIRMTSRFETISNPAIVLFLPRPQNRIEESINPVRSLCHPMLIERTLQRLTQTGNLQNIIDQWGDSSLQELEAFIDMYFEMVWGQAMESCPEESPKEEAVEPVGDVLAYINKKLSKLDVLEDIQEDLVEIKKAIEEMKGKL